MFYMLHVLVIIKIDKASVLECVLLSHQNESWSDQQSTVSDLTLYVHECVELQRSLAGRDVDEASEVSHESVESLNSCPVQLYPGLYLHKLQQCLGP